MRLEKEKKMGMNIGRGDHIMREMARETGLINHDLKRQGQETDPGKVRAGRIACCVLAAFIVLIVSLFLLL